MKEGETAKERESTFPKEAVKAICQRHHIDNVPDTERERNLLHFTVECLAMDASAIPAEFLQADLLCGSSTFPRMSLQEWTAEQRNDPAISRVVDIVNTVLGRMRRGKFN